MKRKLITLSFLVILLALLPVQAGAAGEGIISTDNIADMAVANRLAEHLGLSTIISNWGSFSNETLGRIVNDNITKVYIVGGETALPGAVEALDSLGITIIDRFNGTNRYETSALAASVWRNTSTIVASNGYDEEGLNEALDRAREMDLPLTLLPRDHVPVKTRETLNHLSPSKAILIPSPDMIQNYILIDLDDIGIDVEIVLQNHSQKTLNLIITADETRLDSMGIKSPASLHDRAQETAGKLEKESRERLDQAQTLYDQGFYNLAFTQAVVAKYRAEESIRIKKGITKVPLEAVEEPKPPGKNGTVEIADILLNPSAYNDTQVSVKGKVEEAVEIVGTAYVKLFDGTGRIIVTFPADRESMLSKGYIFMADPSVLDKTVIVNGSVRLNVPLGGGGGHGTSAFAYLIEVDTITLPPEPS